MPPQCQNLKEQVESILQLLHQEPSLRSQDVTPVQTSLGKAISPKFEIVFAGAFSAGKSMLINALLERELLYSAEGHATGTECYIEYAEPDKERVVLTFLSEVEIREQASTLSHLLGLGTASNINQAEVIQLLNDGCKAIIEIEGGESKSERAKQANALMLLLEGFVANRDRIQTVSNATYPMEQFNFSNLQQAADYARRGKNSAVLKRIEYHCNHPLLKDGNVIVDTPGIDAPVERDALLTYDKIKHPDTSAVACILKYAKDGDMTKEETELLETMRGNPGIRDRVFYIFNYIDITWFKPELRRRLDNLISSQFQPPTRFYKTSGLLGFYGSLLKVSGNSSNRWGLDTFLADAEEPHPFVSEFNNYCVNAGKLSSTPFRTEVRGWDSPNENYVRILNDWGKPLIEHLIKDSGIEEFRTAIIDYLTKEKRPQLFKNLADDLEDACISLKKYYQAALRDLDSQPREIEAMKTQELQRLNQQLQQIGQEFHQQITEELNQVVTGQSSAFEADFRQLQSRMVRRLDELLDTFSVADAYSRAILSHPRNSTAPLIAVLVEALYYLANQLEDILKESCQEVVTNLFQRLVEQVRKSDYYRQLYRLLGNDGGIEQKLNEIEKQVHHALVNAASDECNRYVRESPRFYDEGTFSIYQFRQTLLQTSQSYGCESMMAAEPAIRQLLKLDFEPKIKATISSGFPATVNQTLTTNLLPMAAHQADEILQQYTQARAYLEQTLEQEAEEKIATNRRLQSAVEQKVADYNSAVTGINSCLQAMGLYDHQLPVIGQSDVIPVSPNPEAFSGSASGGGVVNSSRVVDVTNV
nr:dynamin-like GTPase family protein [Trichocoleus sp. FACHB-90]